MSEEEQHTAEHAGGADRAGHGAGPGSAGGGAAERAAGGSVAAGAGAGAADGAAGGGGVTGAGGAGGAGAVGGGAADGGAADGGAADGGGAGSWGAHNSVPPSRHGKLRRSRAHKVAGGVCGGLGRYFDLDPVIFRVPLVVLSVVGGLGLIFYGFAWLLIPAEGETQNEGRRLLSGRVEGSSLSAVLVALVGCGLFLASLGSRSVPLSVLLIGVVAGAAYWSRHRRQVEAAGAEGAQIDPATAHAVADAPPEAKAPPVPAPASWWREPLTKEAGAVKGTGPAWGRAGAATGYLWGPEDALPYAAPPSVHERLGAPPGVPAAAGAPGGRPPADTRQGAGFSLGGLTFLLALLAGGIATAVSWDTQPLATTLTVGLSCALGVFGLGLALSAFVGRTGPGTIVCIVLTAGLLAGAAVLPDDISTHFRDTRWVPASVKEVKARYALGSGSGELDLRGTGLKAGQTLRTRTRVGLGELKVVVPKDAVVEVRSDVDVGDVEFPRALDSDGEVIFDKASGLGTKRKLTLRPLGGKKAKGKVVVDLSVGVGRAEIVRELPSGARSDNQQAPDPPAAPSGTPTPPSGPPTPTGAPAAPSESPAGGTR
ncbi:PspC domain-containing protein [Streptomyces oryzae]|uniref:PspC domain-containing protein n=1 Tax=Streptomyces oryzae TaxID=1434886 RepID=A0ABS3XMH4_9ACTN|nr:PspC domain-containing protein [Streptomyces oryzae]MBO8196510.1 PspC domain-containing protein [Streptomyces oryzae]